MPRFAANLTMLFTEVPFLDRFERAARAGFQAVEFLFPYPFEARELRARLDAHGLQCVLHNLPAGGWDAGERGIACVPGREAEFRRGVGDAVRYAHALGVRQLNCLVGIAPAGVDEASAGATVLANLRFAAEALSREGLTLLVEPINRYDIPGFWLHRSEQAIALIDEVGAPNLKLQHDLYHAQRSEGELAATLARLMPRIGHLQIADNPGRHEPGTGEIHWPFLFAEIDHLGYAGWIGCEYKPAAGTEAGLGWRQQLAL